MSTENSYCQFSVRRELWQRQKLSPSTKNLLVSVLSRRLHRFGSEELAKFVAFSQGRTYAQAIAQTLADKAVAGDIRAAQEIADRAEGRSRQSVEISLTSFSDAFDRMSREELETYAREGKLPEWFPRETNNETIQ